MMSNLLLRTVVAACAALGAASVAADEPSDAVHVAIAAQGLSGALTQFGRDTGTEIEFAPDTVRDKSAVAVNGDFQRTQALRLLLQGTGLDYRVTPQGALVVEPAPPARPPGAAPDAYAAPARPASFAKASTAGLDPVTVEARRQREAVTQEVFTYVKAITEPTRDESLATWQIPVCPLVAGLRRDLGEFVLQRVSQTARNADVPLAAEKCHPNFLVVVSANPHDLLQQWSRRHPRAFNETRGVEGIKKFVNSSFPVRIWYNADDGCPGTLTYDIAINVSGAKAFPFPSCSHAGGLGSRLSWEVVRVLSSVIIVADAGRIKDIDIGQFADYVSLIGLAQLRLDHDPGPAPTILRLFGEAREARLQGLSPWDAAFLKALYNTYPDNVVQLSQMRAKMVSYLAP